MLIIYCHFTKDGHCGEVLAAVEEKLREAGKEHEVMEVYKLDFEPKINEEFFKMENFDEQGRYINNPVLRRAQEKIWEHAEIVVIYPTWWGNVPAALKGFYDAVFTPGYAFYYDQQGVPHGLLKGKRALVITTAGGPQEMHAQIKGLRSVKVSTEEVWEFCGCETDGLLIGGCTSERGQIPEEKRQEIRERVREKMGEWIEG